MSHRLDVQWGAENSFCNRKLDGGANFRKNPCSVTAGTPNARRYTIYVRLLR
jgi:hypothetical protein